jgi:hypothetical protein
MVLFDVRTDDSHAGFIAAVNRGLDSEPGNAYLSRFGHVCSPQWWACFDRGELPVEVLTGQVTLVGGRTEPWSDEPEDVIEFRCGEQTIGYDRVEHWAAVPIQVGDRVRITRTVAELQTRIGPGQYVIDLRGEWFPATSDDDHLSR